MLKPIAVATAICGSLDILFAMILTVAFGREIPNMLRYVGSGPFPPAADMGTSGAVIGLLVHFALMAVMAAVLMVYLRGSPARLETPILVGVVYGLITYVVMNLLVVPIRFGTPLPPKSLSIATQLFAHIFLVGIPMALIARKFMRPRLG
jgi:membrane associated rhomboid family serine protease